MEKIILSFDMDRRTPIMDPRPNTNVLPGNSYTSIEISGKKLETVAEKIFRTRVLKNKAVLDMGP